MNHFNLLPPEIIEFIFKKLNLNDLINLRIVDKRFKQICDQIKIKQLCVHDKLKNYSFYFSSFWFYTNDPIYFNKENVIKFTKFQNYSTIFQFDKHLKRLALDLDIDDFNFSILNQFKLLEQLNVTTNKLNDNYKLSLDHLKIADFNLDHCFGFKLTFDTIKLFAFRLVDRDLMNNVVFNYPDKILFFEIDYSNDWDLFYGHPLKNFNNLQYLKLSNLHDSDQIGRDILSRFKNLKMLDLFLQTNFRGYDNLIENVEFLINEKKNLRRSEFEIYFEGVKIINQNKINQFKFSSDPTEFNNNLFEFQIKNYDLLKDNYNTTVINYCDLIKLIKIIPSSFTNKFPFIRYVEANDHIDNEDQFIKFLNNLSYLIDLRLINCKLNKTFYDQLINLVYLNDLEYLIIKDENDLGMNLDFVLNLKQLSYFYTNQIIANHIDLIYKLFEQNQIIRSFIFKIDIKNYIEIGKWGPRSNIKSYYLDDNLKRVNNFSIYNLEDLDDLISKLKELKF